MAYLLAQKRSLTARLPGRSFILSLNPFLYPERLSLVRCIFHKKVKLRKKTTQKLPLSRVNKNATKLQELSWKLDLAGSRGKLLCNYRKSTSIPPTLFQTPQSERPQPLPAWDRRAPGAHGAWEHTPAHSKLQAASKKVHPTYIKTNVCPHPHHFNRVQTSHSFLNAAFQVRIHPQSLVLLQSVYYAIDSPTAPRRKGCAAGDPHPAVHAATFPSSVPPKTLAEGKTLGNERKLEGLEALAQSRVCRRCPWHNSWMQYNRAMWGWNTSWDGWKSSFNSQG